MLIRSMAQATNTMNQLQKQIDTIGHNLANLDTNGFKKTTSSFHELVKQQINNQPDERKEVGRLTDYGIRVGNGAKLQSKVVFEQGVIKKTNRELDIALTNPYQFLQVQVNGEIHYTRDGALYLSPANDGTNRLMLVTSDGYSIVDENENPIYLDDSFKEIIISPNGMLTAVSRNDNDPNQIVQLGIVKVNRPDMLAAQGNNLYRFTEENPDYVEMLNGDLRSEVSVQQGALEGSNVQLATEMTDLITAQRSYQMNARSISIGDQMLGLINNVRS
ncbi:flagellar hook-basal body protein [Aeribacillus alveayuensis]|uniref:Flagellar basal-body rod protein FlgG n=1 Tax=Aeribacillus alveayuensis TaxID=279215 RepID=A0ABT9VNW6_9BACI|nr:flagellar basal-body rod protein FlgG [Bacillus alveayuensis]